jgi:hypothetical protein
MSSPLSRFIQPTALLLLSAVAACAAPEDGAPYLEGQSLALEQVELRAQLAVSSRWSGGYCANVTLRNGSQRTVSGWSVDIDLAGARLGESWSTEATVANGILTASARPDMAVLTPGQQRTFGFCAQELAGRTQPTVIEALGSDLADAPEGAEVQLTLTSEWSNGYCADVAIRNASPARTWTWAATVDPNGTLTSAWSATSEVEGELVTFLPLSWNAVLEPGATAHFGFCAQTTGGQRPVLVTRDPTPVHRLTAAVYMPRRISTCFIGDPCNPETDTCMGLRNDDQELVEAFTTASFAGVRTTSPARASAAKEVCLELVTSAAQEAATLAHLAQFRANVNKWSHGAIELTLDIIPFDHLDLDQSRDAGGLWIAPANLAGSALPELSSAPDYHMVIAPVRDPSNGLHPDLGGCGNSRGFFLGLAGAGYSWLPLTEQAYGYQCADQTIIMREWLQQVHHSYHWLSGFTDPYGWEIPMPMCGAPDPDPHSWFPNANQCNVDPDFTRCGLNDCQLHKDEMNEHVLSEHFDPEVKYYANHCKNGLQDWGESGVDTGADCL